MNGETVGYVKVRECCGLPFAQYPIVPPGVALLFWFMEADTSWNSDCELWVWSELHEN
jgi:hypothetical protein